MPQDPLGFRSSLSEALGAPKPYKVFLLVCWQIFKDLGKQSCNQKVRENIENFETLSLVWWLHQGGFELLVHTGCALCGLTILPYFMIVDTT